MATLYREYRPQNFKELVGQNHIKIILEHEIESGRIAHAYLFCGPRGIGKTTVARVLSKAINCLNRKEEEHDPCNKCEICLEITSGRSLDIIEIDAASHTGVDNVRENIIAASRSAPSHSKYKVFIIDEVHMLSASAFNALLKILEEPPQNVIFILCTTEAHKIPATIISRCQRFDFRRINAGEIVKKLQYVAAKEGIKVDKKILEAIARQSEGHMRDAESLLGQVVAIGGKDITPEEADLVIPRSDLGEAIKLVGILAKKDAGSGIGLINRIIDDGVNLKNFLADLIEILRKIMLTKINPSLAEKLGMELGEIMEIEINKAGRDLDLKKVVAFIEKFSQAKNSLDSSFIMQLPVEVAIAELCFEAGAPSSALASGSSSPPQAVAPKQPKIQPTASTTPKDAGNISNDIISAKWNEVLAKVKSHNHSLSFILQACRPVGLDNNCLRLAFKYKFHKDRIDEVNIRLIVEKVLREVYSYPLTIETVVDENLEDSALVLEKNNILSKDADNQNNNQKTKEQNSKGLAQKRDNINNNDDMVDDLLKTFGGRVIDG